MKVKYNILAALLLTVLTVFVACEKNVISTPGDIPVGARVKFIQACSNCSDLAILNGTVVVKPAVNVLVTANGQTINPTGLIYGGAFPASGYAVLPVGEVTLDFVRTDLSKLLTTKVTLADGKYYSIYVGDTIPTPTISLIEDDIKAFQDTFVRVRFAHILTGKTKDTLELVRKNDNSIVATGVTYGKASEFKFVPSTLADTFFYRKVGTTALYPLTANSIISNRKAQTMTFLARGVNDKTTGAQTAKIDWWVNR